MTPTEAYEFALEKAEELKKHGIAVEIKPYQFRDDKDELIKKYNQPDRIPPEKWVRVTLKYSDKSQAQKIYEATNYLGMCGMYFDTGGMKGLYDWELDWSFSYTGKENEEWQDARKEVEDTIDKLSDKNAGNIQSDN